MYDYETECKFFHILVHVVDLKYIGIKVCWLVWYSYLAHVWVCTHPCLWLMRWGKQANKFGYLK